MKVTSEHEPSCGLAYLHVTPAPYLYGLMPPPLVIAAWAVRRKGVSRSMGMGNRMVELFSEATSVKVCKNRSCSAWGCSLDDPCRPCPSRARKVQLQERC